MKLALLSAALPGFSAERVVEAAVAVGIPAVDWAIGSTQAVPPDARAAARARTLSEGAGLAVCSACIQEPGVDFGDAEAVRRYAAVAEALGAPQLRVFAPPYAPDRDLRAAFEECVSNGVRLLVETSPDTAVPSPELARGLLDGLSSERAGVLYDPGNMIIEGHLAAGYAVDLLGPYLRHVHVKNVAWERVAGEWRWRHARLADGLLDWGAILAALAHAGYGGVLAIDHLAGEPTVQRLGEELAYLAERLP